MKTSLRICAAALLAVGAVRASTSIAQTEIPSGETTPESPRAARMRALNNVLLLLHAEMQEGSPSEAATVITQRAAALGALMKGNPRAALSFAFSPELLADLAARFPESASQLKARSTW